MTQIEALTQCLILALTAPNDKKADQASELAEKIAFGLSVDQVEACKFEALEFVGFEWSMQWSPWFYEYSQNDNLEPA